MKFVVLFFVVACCFEFLNTGNVKEEPPRPKNGYIIFREKTLAGDPNIPPPPYVVGLWKNLSINEREAYITEGNAQRKVWKEYKELYDANINGPLPEEHSLNLQPSDLVSSYLDRINLKWKNSSLSYISLRDNPKYPLPGEIPADTLERVINYRYQHTRSCFGHVGILAFKYVLNEPHMLNMHDAVMKIFGDKESALRGGNSIIFLESLFSKKTNITTVDIANISAELRECGPIVITHFRMDVIFRDRDIFSYDSYEEREGWGYHAMLLIGYREEGGKKWFLLQNTWRSKQFLEVSEEYLRASTAQLFKIVSPEPETNLSISFNLNNNSDMEFNGDDDDFLEEN